MELIIQLKKELAEVTGEVERVAVTYDVDGVAIETPYMVPTYNWLPALKAGAIEVQGLNMLLGENPIFVDPDAINLIPATEDTPEHWEGDARLVFNSTPPSADNGLVRAVLPNYNSIWLSQMPAPTTFSFCLGEPAEAGKII